MFQINTNVVDSLLVTLLSFTRASSQMNYSSATILLPNALTATLFSCSHLFSQFLPLPISCLTAFYTPSVLSDCFPSFSNDYCSFPLYMPSTFPANTLFLSIDCFYFSYLFIKYISFGPFFLEISKLFPSKYWMLSFLVSLSLTTYMYLLSY